MATVYSSKDIKAVTYKRWSMEHVIHPSKFKKLEILEQTVNFIVNRKKQLTFPKRYIKIVLKSGDVVSA